MSGWHGGSDPGRWGNLSPEERIAGHMTDIVDAAGHVRDVLAAEPYLPSVAMFDLRAAVTIIETIAHELLVALPACGPPPQRDPELAEVLDAVADRIARASRLRGEARDTALGSIEDFAAPYALAFFYEIERLEKLPGRKRT
jgi:hypothetical protein